MAAMGRTKIHGVFLKPWVVKFFSGMQSCRSFGLRTSHELCLLLVGSNRRNLFAPSNHVGRKWLIESSASGMSHEMLVMWLQPCCQLLVEICAY